MRTLLLCLCLCIPNLCFAQDAEWWFDIEVIIFDRNQHISELKEHFVPDKTLNMPLADNDLLTALREPNVSWLYQSLDSCAKNDLVLTEQLPFIEWQIEKQQTELAPSPFSIADFSLAEQWLFFNTDEGFKRNTRSDTSVINMPNIGCKESGFNYQSKLFPMLKVQPVNHFGTLNDNIHTTALLSKSGLELEELSLRIRSERGLTRLLHVAWRQEVEFGRENAKSMRLYGGNNYGFHFTEHGVLHPNTESMETPIVLDTPIAVFENSLDSALSLATNSSAMSSAEQFEQRLGYSLKTDTPINIVEPNITQSSKDIWQIEGRFKVFLQYVNRVPYLHIDSDIAYRQAVDSTVQGKNEQTLISISDHPFRRVISTQLHYFDHPLYGMLVEIRRVKKK
jgi:hypothetical protein